MIQFNLLPDVKVQFIKTRRASHTVIIVAILLTMAVGTGTFLLNVQAETREAQLEELTKEASSIFADIQQAEIDVLSEDKDRGETSAINELLTIQAQLGALTSLHEQKVAARRFSTYLEQILPKRATVSTVSFDFEKDHYNFTISGKIEDSLDDPRTGLVVVNVLIDTFEFTEYIIGEDEDTRKRAFVMGPPNIADAEEDQKASFSVSGTFDPIIFDSQKEGVRMIVPNIDSTHQKVEDSGEVDG